MAFQSFTVPEQAATVIERQGYDSRNVRVLTNGASGYVDFPITYTQARQLAEEVREGTEVRAIWTTEGTEDHLQVTILKGSADLM